MQEFTSKDIFLRRVRRIAELLRDHWEEGSGFDTRFFEVPFIHDQFVLRGKSKNGGGYREHIVPRVIIRDGCISMLNEGAQLEAVQNAIVQNLGIVEITPNEAYQLDVQLKMKTTMPPGWRFGVDDPMARIKAGGIEILN